MSETETPAALVTTDSLEGQSSEPVAEPKITAEMELAEKAKVAAQFGKLKAQPLVKIRIPKVHGPQVVIINGARYNVASNIWVEVPEQVAQILADSGRI